MLKPHYASDFNCGPFAVRLGCDLHSSMFGIISSRKYAFDFESAGANFLAAAQDFEARIALVPSKRLTYIILMRLDTIKNYVVMRLERLM